MKKMKEDLNEVKNEEEKWRGGGRVVMRGRGRGSCGVGRRGGFWQRGMKRWAGGGRRGGGETYLLPLRTPHCSALFGITIKHAKLSIHLYIHITIQPSNKKYRVDKEIKIQYKDCKVTLHTCGIAQRGLET